MSSLASIIHAFSDTQTSASVFRPSSREHVNQLQQDTTAGTTSNRTEGPQEETQTFTRFLPADPNPNQQKWVLSQLWNLIALLGINIGIPLAIYYSIRNDIGIVYALLISGIPPLLYAVYIFYREHRVDLLSCIICLSFVLSAVVSVITGDARILLVRDGAVSAVIGFFFLITLIPLKTRWFTVRPMVFLVGRQLFAPSKYRWMNQQGQAEEILVSEWQWQELKLFRCCMCGLTAGFGLLLILAFVATLIMVYAAPQLSVDTIINYNNIINGAVVGAIVVSTIVCLVFIRRDEIRVGRQWAEENDYSDKV
ncbi:hypothetical protein BDA99DRAFT_442748 [Phascolomyces articulosus]|uniref:Uncharacterized protein n=1 Tax=Phascolomyces articulosus TaxID=60185 RepID=A0AAD5K3U3_9FUNG|nr:hypothetical protein BDA99DRAFT_442748 [Phascolomyces articulosus]